MKVKDIIKKQTTIIAIAVVLVTMTVIGVSYAIFFDVGANKQDQVITAGTLKMTISGIQELDLSEPASDEVGIHSDPVSYTVENTNSNLPAVYNVYIYGDSTNQVALSKIKVSLDGSTTKALTECSPTVIDGKTYYRISNENETLAAGARATTKQIRVWLNEDLMQESEAGQTVGLSMYIVSEVNE